MKKKIYNWFFKKALKIIAVNVVKYGKPLTPEYLLKLGWVELEGYYFDPYMKARDVIQIRFDKHWYYVTHSSKKTYIATENTQEWFENYILLIAGDKRRFELAGI
jgi:hypothetical protein